MVTVLLKIICTYFTESNWPKLRILDWSNVTAMDNDCFDALMTSAPNLESLNLTGYTKTAVKELNPNI